MTKYKESVVYIAIYGIINIFNNKYLKDFLKIEIYIFEKLICDSK